MNKFFILGMCCLIMGTAYALNPPIVDAQIIQPLTPENTAVIKVYEDRAYAIAFSVTVDNMAACQKVIATEIAKHSSESWAIHGYCYNRAGDITYETRGK